MIPMIGAGGFSWFQALGFPTHIVIRGSSVPMDPVYHTLLVTLLLILSALMARRAFLALPSGPEALVPEDRLSHRTFWELFCEGYLSFLRTMLQGKDAVRYFPLLATLFLFIFFSNAIALIPGFQPPTANLSTNLAMATVVFVVYNGMGIKEQGFVSYLKHFAGPIIWLAPLMFVIEIVSHVARPFSLSVRLFGNMFGDHMVMESFLHLTYLIIPVIFIGLGLFVSLVQAFVFSLLSTVYISMAVTHEEGAH